jgi:hypothetical protein
MTLKIKQIEPSQKASQEEDMRKTARCSASGPLKKALDKVIHIIYSEFRIRGDRPRFRGDGCHEIRQEWEDVARELRFEGKEKRQKKLKLESLIKSVKRIFDFECRPCDKKASEQARRSWQSRVATDCSMPPADWCHDPIWLVRKRVRELISGWGSRLKAARESEFGWKGAEKDWGGMGYVPDQQGCLETTRLEGGTLGTAPDECGSDFSLVRVGVAKTKGKFRVVTMQSAYVKRKLSPVHTALYDHISSYDWCVRGDVRREDFEAVFNDKKKGENVISGDYREATNLIYLEVVEAIVAELAECPELEEEERNVLVKSFKDLRWISKSGLQHPIKRGSMMGNLVSFPLLCLLNKACFDISCDIFYGSGKHRKGRFNGDDCVFAGSREFSDFWRKVTGTFGLVVNEEKTGMSDNWGELNSQPCLSSRKGLNARPVISFLRPFRSEPDGLVGEVYRGIRTLSRDTRAWIWNVAMRHEISAREICVSELPDRTVNYLLTKRWFRRALELGPAPIEKTGVERKMDSVVRNPPKREAWDFVTSASDQLQREHTAKWLGVKLHVPGGLGPPMKRVVNTSAYWSSQSRKKSKKIKHPENPWYLRKGSARWQFVWPKPVYEWFSRKYPHLLMSDEECLELWMDDHPFLTTKVDLEKSCLKPQYRYNFSPPQYPRSFSIGPRFNLPLPRKGKLGFGLLRCAYLLRDWSTSAC